MPMGLTRLNLLLYPIIPTGGGSSYVGHIVDDNGDDEHVWTVDMDQGGLNLIWVLSKRTAGGIKAIFRPIYLSFRCKIWMGNVSALFALRRKKAK